MQKFKDKIINLMPDILAAGGAISISYGAYLLSPPLGYIIGGLLMVASAYLCSRAI